MHATQYIVSSLFGIGAGVGLCALIGQSFGAAFVTATVLAGVSQYGAYRTVKSIPLVTLNSTRLQVRQSSLAQPSPPCLSAGPSVH